MTQHVRINEGISVMAIQMNYLLLRLQKSTKCIHITKEMITLWGCFLVTSFKWTKQGCGLVLFNAGILKVQNK